MHSFSKRFLLCGLFSIVLMATACNTSQQAIVTKLAHAPSLSAVARLRWDQKTNVLTVQVAAAGLAPNSTHPEHIHAGTCASNPMGPIVYKLRDLQANADGVGESITTINNVQNGILASGWYVNIHTGPTLNTAAEAKPIACGNVQNKDTSTQKSQSVIVTLAAK